MERWVSSLWAQKECSGFSPQRPCQTIPTPPWKHGACWQHLNCSSLESQCLAQHMRPWGGWGWEMRLVPPVDPANTEEQSMLPEGV